MKKAKKPSSQPKTRDLEKSRKEILGAAFEEIFARGFQGVSIDDIVGKTSLTKGAFYHQFPTKLDLGYALVDEVIKPMIIERWIHPLEEYENPLEGILAQIKILVGEQRKHWHLGCPLNNLVQEMAPIDKEFKLRLSKALQLWIEKMALHLERAKKNGFLKSSVNPKEVAYFVVMTHEGFYGMLKGIDSPKAFQALYESLRSYFKTLEA